MKNASPARACGIDFGTSNSTVGWLRPGMETLIALEDDKITLPSVVFFNMEERRPVYGRLALHERLADAPLQFDQAPLHGGLVDTERTAGGQRAAVSGDGQQMFEIVPVEAVRAMRHCGPILQFCALRREAPAPKLGT